MDTHWITIVVLMWQLWLQLHLAQNSYAVMLFTIPHTFENLLGKFCLFILYVSFQRKDFIIKIQNHVHTDKIHLHWSMMENVIENHLNYFWTPWCFANFTVLSFILNYILHKSIKTQENIKNKTWRQNSKRKCRSDLWLMKQKHFIFNATIHGLKQESIWSYSVVLQVDSNKWPPYETRQWSMSNNFR